MLKDGDRVIIHETGRNLLWKMNRCFSTDLRAVVRMALLSQNPPLSTGCSGGGHCCRAPRQAHVHLLPARSRSP